MTNKTHLSQLVSRIQESTSNPTTDVEAGRAFYDTDDNRLSIYNGTSWKTAAFTTTTSTSTSTTSTSTSTTSTSSSSSSSTSTSLTTSTSTTTTL